MPNENPADAESHDLVISRLVRAPRAALWRAWTDPALLPQWFGPIGYACKTKEIDLREGGLWRFDMIGPDGTIWPNRHRYTVMQPTNRLEFLMDGDDDATAPMQVCVTLTPEAGGTRIVQTILFPSVAALEGAKAFGAVELGQTTLAKLEAMARSL